MKTDENYHLDRLLILSTNDIIQVRIDLRSGDKSVPENISDLQQVIRNIEYFISALEKGEYLL